MVYFASSFDLLEIVEASVMKVSGILSLELVSTFLGTGLMMSLLGTPNATLPLRIK